MFRVSLLKLCTRIQPPPPKNHEFEIVCHSRVVHNTTMSIVLFDTCMKIELMLNENFKPLILKNNSEMGGSIVRWLSIGVSNNTVYLSLHAMFYFRQVVITVRNPISGTNL